MKMPKTKGEQVATVAELPKPKGASIGKRLSEFAGAMKGLPSDMSLNHDHYLHGQKKR